MTTTKSWQKAAVLAAAAALFLTACSNGGSEETATSADPKCAPYADVTGLEGTEVTIYTSIIDPEATLFQQSYADFEECTGITIVWMDQENSKHSFQYVLKVETPQI